MRDSCLETSRANVRLKFSRISRVRPSRTVGCWSPTTREITSRRSDFAAGPQPPHGENAAGWEDQRCFSQASRCLVCLFRSARVRWVNAVSFCNGQFSDCKGLVIVRSMQTSPALAQLVSRISAGLVLPGTGTSFAKVIPAKVRVRHISSRTALWRRLQPFFLQFTKWSPNGSEHSPHSGHRTQWPSGSSGRPSQYRHKVRNSSSDKVV